MSARPKSLEETLGAGLSLLLGDVPEDFLEEGGDDAPSVPPPRPPAPFAVEAPPAPATCVRCDGEREVVTKGVVRPCPVCRGGR